MFDSKKNRIILIVSAAIIVALVVFALLRDTSQEVSLNQVESLIVEKKIEHIVQSDGYFYIKTPTTLYRIPTTQVSPSLLQSYTIEVDKGSSYLVTIVLILLAMGAVSYGVRYWMKMQGNDFGSGMPFAAAVSSKSSEGEGITPVVSDVTFDDIGGISDVKQELQEIIEFLRNPSRFKSFGARMPRGVLLVGPPGVGKTMIAKAVAAEAGVPFYYQSAASFVQIYVGMGAKRVHELFVAAKNNSPAIIFIDEIDAVGKERDGNRSDEREA
ncbi:MAG: AAA family ATPase, partial [Sulfurimonadaceae bacterium]